MSERTSIPPTAASSASLRACLRLGAARLGPALGGPARASLPARLVRAVSGLADWPLALPPGTRFLLASPQGPNSKAGAVISELTACGIAREAIWTPADQSDHLLARGWRVGRWLVRWLCAPDRRLPRVSDVVALRLVAGRAAARDVLARHPEVMPIIISDVSPTLHMAWSASIALGRPPLWWQDDYHHVKPLPATVGMAVALNEGGLRAARTRDPELPVFARPRPEANPLREVGRRPRVGIATNASFRADPAQAALIADLGHRLDACEMIARLHPNSPLHGRANIAGCTVAPADETMAAFAARIDIAVVGNSAAQLQLLREGTPVLHVAGLDGNGFDLYRYVARGVCFGAEHPDEIALDDLRAHYRDARNGEKIRKFLDFAAPDQVPPLGALAAERSSALPLRPA